MSESQRCTRAQNWEGFRERTAVADLEKESPKMENQKQERVMG